MDAVQDRVRVERLADGAAMVSIPQGYMDTWLSDRRWPGHNLTPKAFEVTFDAVGNLVDLSIEQDGPAMLALVGEAQAIAIGVGALPDQLTLPPDRASELLQEAVVLNAAYLDPADLALANAALGWEPRPVTNAGIWFTRRWDIPSATFHHDIRTDVTTTTGREVAFLSRVDGGLPADADLAAHRAMAASLQLKNVCDMVDDALGAPRRELPLMQFPQQRPAEGQHAGQGVVVSAPGVPETLIRRPSAMAPREFDQVLSLLASGPSLLREVRDLIDLYAQEPDLQAALQEAATAIAKADPQILVLMKDGQERYRGTDNECHVVLHALQGQSAEYAMQWGGWSLEPRPDASPALPPAPTR